LPKATPRQIQPAAVTASVNARGKDGNGTEVLTPQ
jgi:hypothetical protein